MSGTVVAIQGERGAFSEEAAEKLFGRRLRTLPCESFAAAFAGRAAAKAYRARILRAHLEDHKENYTRFVLLSKDCRPTSRADKTSIVFSTPNVPGALFRCLSAFALRDINLTTLESRPWRGRPWEYLFYLDFIGHVEEERTRRALTQPGEMTDFL